MSYLKSTNVKMYPSPNRGLDDNNEQIDAQSKLGTEYNITNTINSLTNYKSFIISDDITNNKIKICVRGYIFELEFDTIPNGDVYASIKLNEENGLIYLSNFELENKDLDKDGEFKGLFLDSQEQAGDNVYSLLILRNGEIPAESRIRFNSELINIDSVGGFANDVNTLIKEERGKIVESTKIYFGTTIPTSGNYVNGDLYFKYKG